MTEPTRADFIDYVCAVLSPHDYGEPLHVREHATQIVDYVFLAYLAAVEADLRMVVEAARMLIAEVENDVVGQYSSPAIRALRRALARPGIAVRCPEAPR